MAVIVREKVNCSGEWWVFINHKGKRRSKKIGSKKAANAVKREVEARLANGDLGLLQEKKPTLAEYGRKLIFEPHIMEWADTTRSNYTNLFEGHIEPYAIAKMDLNKIERRHVAEWLTELKKHLAKSSIKTVVAMASGFLQHAIEFNIVETNPFSRTYKLIGSKQKKDGLALDPGNLKVYSKEEAAEVVELSKLLGIRDHAFVTTMLRSGMRLGEMLGLEWQKIDFEKRTALVDQSWDYRHRALVPPKNGKPRLVNLSQYVIEVLQELQTVTPWAGPVDPLFVSPTSPTGDRLSDSSIRSKYYRIRPKPVTLHGLRHSYATLRVAAGHNIVDVSNQLGHASVAFTLERYTHWLPSEHKHEVDELDTLHLSAPYTHPEQTESTQVADLTKKLH